MENIKKNPLSLQLNAEDFLPASNEEKQSLVVMRESVNFWKDGIRRLKKNKIAMVSFVFIIAIAIFAYLLPAVWPYSYSEQMKGSNNLKPFEYSASEQARIDAGEKVFPHILGTDRMGRDFAVRIMMGTRVSLSVGLIASVLVLIIGATYGAISAFAGGWVDNIIMRVVDVFYCIPSMPVIIIIGAAMDAMRIDSWTRMMYLMLILGFLGWPGIARLVRGQILSLREQEFMLATEACGIKIWHRIFRHLIPNVIPQLIVTCTMGLGSTILTEATLSFLGLGVKYPFASWGNIINDVNNAYVMTNYLFIWIPAGVCLLLTVLGFNFVGDGLRDAFDPKMKR